LFLALPLQCQTFQGTILGSVRDSSGALVAGAKVKVIETNTNSNAPPLPTTRLAQSSRASRPPPWRWVRAAGTAAAMSQELKRTVQELDGRKVRDALDQIHAGPFNG